MVLYHRTAHAQEIVAERRFPDDAGNDGTTRGVWLSSGLQGCGDGAEDDAVLVLKLPIALIRHYEQVRVGQTYRTYLVPASVVNQHAGRVVARTSWTRVRTAGATPSNRAEGLTLSAETPRPFFAPVPDQRDAEALIHELAARVVDAVREHLQTHPSHVWPRWLTTATCARYIDRSPAGIRGLVARGTIPYVKREGLVYFDRLVLDRWMAGKVKARGKPSTRARLT